MKFKLTNWKSDFIYLIPNIAIYIDKDEYTSIYIKLSFLKYNLGLIIINNTK